MRDTLDQNADTHADRLPAGSRQTAYHISPEEQRVVDDVIRKLDGAERAERERRSARVRAVTSTIQTELAAEVPYVAGTLNLSAAVAGREVTLGGTGEELTGRERALRTGLGIVQLGLDAAGLGSARLVTHHAVEEAAHVTHVPVDSVLHVPGGDHALYATEALAERRTDDAAGEQERRADRAREVQEEARRRVRQEVLRARVAAEQRRALTRAGILR